MKLAHDTNEDVKARWSKFGQAIADADAAVKKVISDTTVYQHVADILGGS